MTLYIAKNIHMDELLFRLAFCFIELNLHRWAPFNFVGEPCINAGVKPPKPNLSLREFWQEEIGQNIVDVYDVSVENVEERRQQLQVRAEEEPREQGMGYSTPFACSEFARISPSPLEE